MTVLAADRRASWIATPAVPDATSRTLTGCGRDDVVDHRAAPPAVLAKRKHLGQTVVPSGKLVEQLLRNPVGIGGCRHPHRASRAVNLQYGHWHREAWVGDERFDVLVVGAGPAGSVAALTLARVEPASPLSTRPNFHATRHAAIWSGPVGFSCSTISGSVWLTRSGSAT